MSIVFPAHNMAIVEDQNRNFIRHQESLHALQVSDHPLILINPHFSEDSDRLDGNFELARVASDETVFIIAGETIVSDLLDRITCGVLRDAIDRKGKGQSFRRAIIVSEASWTRDKLFTEHCPAICIGSEAANKISKEWLGTAKQKGIAPFPLGSGHGVYLSDPQPRAILYGSKAADTKSAVEKYIEAPRGLGEFLSNCWH